VAKKAVKKTGPAADLKAPAPREVPADMPESERTGMDPQSQVPPVRGPLSADQLAHFRALLLEKLEEITGDVDHLESGSLKSSRGDAAGDLSSMPIHMADIGSDNYEQEFSLGLMSSERKIVREIIAALKRIDKGTYGICEGTGQPISLARLNGIPWARYCIQYAEKLEKGLVTPPSRADMPADTNDEPTGIDEDDRFAGADEDDY